MKLHTLFIGCIVYYVTDLYFFLSVDVRHFLGGGFEFNSTLAHRK